MSKNKSTLQEELEVLESLSKPLHELVVSEKFTVDEVIAESQEALITPDSERIPDGTSPVYEGGYTSHLVLRVMPRNENVPVRTLTFDGFSPAKSGDYISAKIPRYRKNVVELNLPPLPSPGRYQTYYLEREFYREEVAIELKILSEDGRILRTDRAIDYKKFIKEEK